MTRSGAVQEELPSLGSVDSVLRNWTPLPPPPSLLLCCAVAVAVAALSSDVKFLQLHGTQIHFSLPRVCYASGLVLVSGSDSSTLSRFFGVLLGVEGDAWVLVFG